MKIQICDTVKSNSRRKFLQNTGTTAAGTVLASYAPMLLAQSKGPIRIGVLNTFSKTFAALGNANLNGMSLFFDQIGYTIAGRKIEIVREDDEANAQVGLQKLKKLVESDKCDVVTGIQASNVAMAAVEYIRQSKAFVLCSGAGATQLSYVNVPYLFRCSVSSHPQIYAMGEWFYKNISKDVMLTASDYAGGRGTMVDFRLGFQKQGGKIIKEIYPPVGTNDFSAYLADIRNSGAAATFNFYAGSDAVRFVKQYDEFGIRGKAKLAGSGFMFESDSLPAQGRSAIGALNVLHYAETLENAANRKFVAAYLAKYKEYPNVYAEYGYVAGQLLHAALSAVDGNTADKDRLRGAMLSQRIEAPRGPFRINPASQSPIHNTYIREVIEINGRITNKVIHTIENSIDPLTNPN